MEGEQNCSVIYIGKLYYRLINESGGEGGGIMASRRLRSKIARRFCNAVVRPAMRKYKKRNARDFQTLTIPGTRPAHIRLLL